MCIRPSTWQSTSKEMWKAMDFEICFVLDEKQTNRLGNSVKRPSLPLKEKQFASYDVQYCSKVESELPALTDLVCGLTAYADLARKTHCD